MGKYVTLLEVQESRFLWEKCRYIDLPTKVGCTPRDNSNLLVLGYNSSPVSLKVA